MSFICIYQNIIVIYYEGDRENETKDLHILQDRRIIPRDEVSKEISLLNQKSLAGLTVTTAKGSGSDFTQILNF